jgi:hypothetical protein
MFVAFISLHILLCDEVLPCILFYEYKLFIV